MTTIAFNSKTAMISFPPPLGALPSIEWIPVGSILVDERYQRSIDSARSKKLIETIAFGWDWRLFDPIRLSKRSDDLLYVIDGQHRVAAAQLRGDLPQLPAIVGRYDNAAAEAKLFIGVNTARKNPTMLDKFRARLMAEDADAIAVSRVIEQSGFVIGRTVKIKPGTIVCLSLVERLYRRYGDKSLYIALSVLSETFPGEGCKCAEELLQALCSLSKTHDKAALMALLRGRSQSDWSLEVQRYRNEHRTVAYGQDGCGLPMLRELLLKDAPQTNEVSTMADPLFPPIQPPSRERLMAGR